MNDHDVRDFLSDMADEVGDRNLDPAPVIRRARRRRTALFVATGVAAVLVALGAFAGLDALRAPSDPLPADPAPGVDAGAILVGETLVDLEEGTETAIPFCDGCLSTDISWAPEGDRFVFVDPCTTCDENDPAVVRVFDVTSEEFVGDRLLSCTVGPDEDRRACSIGVDWSPDGDRIAIAHSYGLEVVDLESGSRESVTHFRSRRGVIGHPSWAPDGDSIMFSMEFTNHPESRLIASAPAAGGPTEILYTENDDRITISDPAWSSTGEKFAFLRRTERGDLIVPEVMVQRWSPTQGSLVGEPRILFRGEPCECPGLTGASPRWSPDGERLAWTGGSDEGAGLIVIEEDGDYEVVTEGVFGQPAWHP